VTLLVLVLVLSLPPPQALSTRLAMTQSPQDKRLDDFRDGSNGLFFIDGFGKNHQNVNNTNSDGVNV
jgi:hypothetical protein